jgi:hypothetical protein
MNTKKSPYRCLIFFALALALLLGVFFAPEYMPAKVEHKLGDGLFTFKLSDPPPACDSWKRHMPSYRDPAAYKLYISARNLLHSKIEWQLSRAETTRILADVRRAADMGDWGARALMSNFYLYGLGPWERNHVLDPAPEKAIEIIKLAASLDMPWGFYELGRAYESGYGGVTADSALAWAYFSRAAKLGSPEAQMTLAEVYEEAGQHEDEEAMRLCAYRQRYGPAAYALSTNQRLFTEDYAEAIRYLQDGVEFGDKDSASLLERLFDEGYWSHMGEQTKPKLAALGIKADAVRGERYKVIRDALEVNPDLKFTRVRQALPLPPAKLPPWEGVGSALELESGAPPTY